MKNTKYFKPKAHILRLLGDELIKSPIMAIYELVKNSYDADSKFVNVNFKNIGNINSSTIVIEDNGTGLTSQVIESVWLEPGNDHRKPIDKNGERIIKRSPIFQRVPTGEKGVGRFAVHKLGDKIKLVTRPSKIVIDPDGKPTKEALDYEITLNIDWKVFSQSKYLDEIPITWTTETDISKFHFKNDSGTLIEISAIKEAWTRGMARSLKRNTVAMLSPKNNNENFMVNLDFETDWIDDFPNAKQILEVAPYKYYALLDKDYNLTVDYEFSLARNDTFGKRKINSVTENIKGSLIPIIRKELESEHLSKDEVDEQLEKLQSRENPFGDILIELYSFDLDSTTLQNYTLDSRTLRDVLKQHAGIKVFKDDMRVFDYGEPGNDWLELDLRRVQNKEWFSNNQNIGYIYLDSEKSTSLIEKTSREGFIDNKTFKIFYQSVVLILNNFRAERLKDRNKWLTFLEPVSKAYSYKDQVSLFNDLIDSTDFSVEEQKTLLKDEVEKLQKDFEVKKETMLIPAGVGMTASVALHEIEKLVPIMREVVKDNPFKKDLALEKIDELKEYLDGILSVLRKGGNKPIDVKESLDKAISNYSSKLNKRNIKLDLSHDENIKTIKCDKRYFITMIMNIIENSIYWLDTIYKDNKGIYIKTFIEHNSVSIILADNGPGFKDEITDVVRPFFSRKDDGIGIGLYLVDTLMMKYGKLDIITSEEELKDLDIPSDYRGAILKLKFTRN